MASIEPNENPYRVLPDGLDVATPLEELLRHHNVWRWRGKVVAKEPFKLPEACCLTNRVEDITHCEPLLVPRQLTFWLLLALVVPVFGALSVVMLLAYGLKKQRIKVPVTRDSNAKVSMSQLFGELLVARSVLMQLGSLTTRDLASRSSAVLASATGEPRMPSIIPPGVALRLEAGAFGLGGAVVPFVKTATRSGRLLITDMTEYIPEEVWRSRDRIQQVQTQRLRELLAAVSEGNSFWQERFKAAAVDVGSIESLEDLQRLPVLFKQDLVDDQLANLPYGTNLTFAGTEYSRLHQTSGTTGKPLRWLDTPDSWDWMAECWRQIYHFAGLTAEDVLFLPFSFGPFIGFWGAFDGACRLGNLCIAGGGMSTDVRLRVLAENSATVLCCTPTYALRMAEVAEAEGVDLASGTVRMLIVAGEPGGSIPATRKRIETAWGARVIDHWGMTEIGSPGVEAVNRPGGLYLLETEFIAEVVAPETYEPVPAGEQGELLITNLGRIGSPVIRYRTGDLVRAAVPDPADEIQLTWLDGGILGRADDMVTVRGNNVFPSSIEAILREFDDVAEFRINIETKREMNHLSIEVEPTESRTDGLDDLEEEIRKRLKNRLGFQCDLQLVQHGALPRFEMKGRRLHRK